MRTTTRTLLASFVSFFFIGATAGPALAQDAAPAAIHQISIGPRVGLQLKDNTEFMIGAEARFGLLQIVPTVRLDIRPFFGYYFESDFTIFDLGADALFAFDIKQEMFEPYAGAGLAIGRVSFDRFGVSASDTNVGLTLLGGARFLQRTRIQPFVEIRLGLGDWDPITLAGGVLFVL
jgi:hypothetical protein